jgi:predicted RNA binding protein YcfA (HicA-like mRNA interferase family)
VSKLPVISGAECIKALEKIGFIVYLQRAAISPLYEQPHQHKQQSQTTKN